jgi:hypothetical protein
MTRKIAVTEWNVIRILKQRPSMNPKTLEERGAVPQNGK